MSTDSKLSKPYLAQFSYLDETEIETRTDPVGPENCSSGHQTGLVLQSDRKCHLIALTRLTLSLSLFIHGTHLPPIPPSPFFVVPYSPPVSVCPVSSAPSVLCVAVFLRATSPICRLLPPRCLPLPRRRTERIPPVAVLLAFCQDAT
ncbi:hypothetical protein PIB30_027941 [Stylosanthes scabra]|uniref:Uncharacterized protein n=1 Tax=Stylosanthes scabra TaxID=79078 RepID=A0ABU6SAK1_9FABA|nr:hypothetical protein [Stylosanthes scabra]